MQFVAAAEAEAATTTAAAAALPFVPAVVNDGWIVAKNMFANWMGDVERINNILILVHNNHNRWIDAN